MQKKWRLISRYEKYIIPIFLKARPFFFKVFQKKILVLIVREVKDVASCPKKGLKTIGLRVIFYVIYKNWNLKVQFCGADAMKSHLKYCLKVALLDEEYFSEILPEANDRELLILHRFIFVYTITSVKLALQLVERSL